MDKAVRESVAALWEPMAAAIGNGALANGLLIESMMKAINTSLEAGGYTHKDVADWLRKDMLVIDGMDEVKTKPEEDEEVAMHFAMVRAIIDKHMAVLHPKEAKFVTSIGERLGVEGRPLSYKQREWLFQIARKYGV